MSDFEGPLYAPIVSSSLITHISNSNITKFRKAIATNSNNICFIWYEDTMDYKLRCRTKKQNDSSAVGIIILQE